MPVSDVHKKKLKKNLVVLGLIFVWCFVIWMVTVVKLANAHDIEKSFIGQRAGHQKTMDSNAEQFKKDWAAGEAERQKTQADMDAQRQTRLKETVATKEQWDNGWRAQEGARAAADRARDTQRAAHRDELAKNPARWWENWQDKLNPER